MSEFIKYRRTAIAEMRDVTEDEISGIDPMGDVSISEADKKAGSPRRGDKVARNPKNHDDKWLVAMQYFKDNFEELDGANLEALA